jgi:hypothetical protein
MWPQKECVFFVSQSADGYIYICILLCHLMAIYIYICCYAIGKAFDRMHLAMAIPAQHTAALVVDEPQLEVAPFLRRKIIMWVLGSKNAVMSAHKKDDQWRCTVPARTSLSRGTDIPHRYLAT